MKPDDEANPGEMIDQKQPHTQLLMKSTFQLSQDVDWQWIEKFQGQGSVYLLDVKP